MKARTTISLPDGTQITIESPSVCGLSDMSRLARLLDGEDATSVYGSDFGLPPGFGEKNHGEFIAIPINDAPLNAPRDITRVLVAQWPLMAPIVAGALLERSDGKWYIGAGIYDDITAKMVPAVLIRERWAVWLARFAIDELQPYLQLAPDLTRVVDARIVREVQSRCAFYNQRDLDGFFRESSRPRLWEMIARWADWDDRGLSAEDRLEEWENFDPSVSFTVKVFGDLVVGLGLSLNLTAAQQARKNVSSISRRPPPETRPELFTILRGNPANTIRLLSEFHDDEELQTVFTSGDYPAVGPDASLSEKEFALTRDWSPEKDAIFSYGGDPSMNYDLDAGIHESFPSSNSKVVLENLLDHVWWWKACMKDFVVVTRALVESASDKALVDRVKCSTWDRRLTSLFLDNWEWSAFLYEFRARYNRRYVWDPFGKPWVKLNHTERGILAIWWPPRHAGSQRIRPNLSPVVLQRMKSLVTMKLQHDLNSPGAVAEERVLTGIKELAAKNGYSVPGKGEGRRPKVPWRALHYLDLEHFLGRRFPDSESKLKRTTAQYEAACKDAGVRP